MGYIYLIGEIDNDGVYKIGVTKRDDIDNRKRALQTGNSTELFIKDKYKSSNVFKLEKMLHRHYMIKHKLNEWFELTSDDVKGFINTCEKYESIIDSLKDNPFFNKKSKPL